MDELHIGPQFLMEDASEMLKTLTGFDSKLHRSSPDCIAVRKHRYHAMSYIFISIITFLVLQSLIVVMHELTHSSMAWTLGHIKSPLDIVWGNPLTMTGWDEGVDYDRIFVGGHNYQAAIIGFCPIIMHSSMIVIGIHLMGKHFLFHRKWLFHIVFWFVAGNFMELVAYIFMRSFSGQGDIGLFNRGTSLSPWLVFIIGSGLLIWELKLFFRCSLPRLQALFAKDNLSTMWTMLVLTSFIIFLWGSGIRVMMYVTGPQWLFGLIGIPAFILSIIWARPGRFPMSAS